MQQTVQLILTCNLLMLLSLDCVEVMIPFPVQLSQLSAACFSFFNDYLLTFELIFLVFLAHASKRLYSFQNNLSLKPVMMMRLSYGLVTFPDYYTHIYISFIHFISFNFSCTHVTYTHNVLASIFNREHTGSAKFPKCLQFFLF